jgi:subtilisin family serine protease
VAREPGPEFRSPIVGDLRLPAAARPSTSSAQPAPPSASSDGESEPSPDHPVDVLLELNVQYPGGITAVRRAFFALWVVRPGQPERVGRAPRTARSRPPDGLRRVTSKLYQCTITRADLQELIAADRAAGQDRPPTIFKAWPDYELRPQIDRSAPTVKADAGWRSYNARGHGVVWAVIDSGVDARHRHFSALELHAEGAAGRPAAQLLRTGNLHRDFGYLVAPRPDAPPPDPSPLTDELGHGTHVAGIIAGECPVDVTPTVASSDEPQGGEGFVPRAHSGRLSGMAPECELVSLKVMRRTDQGTWVTSSAAVIAALDYIRTEVNLARNALRIHGVNLSLGCEWDPSHYAAGQSPLCQAINELVESGVLVVVSAGNGGKQAAPDDTRQSVSLMGTITEPGHAEGCITVGSTHRDAPHAFGISWTSGKGPTLDGRPKPDVVAPGEWITSAATGAICARAGLGTPEVDPTTAYAEQTGTSMAAPHVSGVLAQFLSARPEFVGRPSEVKQMLRRTATDLGREPYAQGAGVVDAMRLLSDS